MFYFRYLIFTHLFLACAVARLVAKIPVATFRRGKALWLLANSAVICLLWRYDLNLAERPGMKAAAAFVNQHRRTDEPVVVAGPMYFYPALYYIKGDPAVRLQSRGREPFWRAGAAVARAEDFMTQQQLESLMSDRLWTIGAVDTAWGAETVPVPHGWRKIAERRYPEAYRRLLGTIVVREYRRSRRR